MSIYLKKYSYSRKEKFVLIVILLIIDKIIFLLHIFKYLQKQQKIFLVRFSRIMIKMRTIYLNKNRYLKRDKPFYSPQN